MTPRPYTAPTPIRIGSSLVFTDELPPERPTRASAPPPEERPRRAVVADPRTVLVSVADHRTGETWRVPVTVTPRRAEVGRGWTSKSSPLQVPPTYLHPAAMRAAREAP